MTDLDATAVLLEGTPQIGRLITNTGDNDIYTGFSYVDGVNHVGVIRPDESVTVYDSLTYICSPLETTYDDVEAPQYVLEPIAFVGPAATHGTAVGGGVIGAGLTDSGGYGVGSSRDSEGLVHTCGFLSSAGALAVNSSIFTLPNLAGANHRPGFTVITSVMCFLGGGTTPTQVGVQIDAAGVIELTSALVADDLVCLDSLPPFRGA